MRAHVLNQIASVNDPQMLARAVLSFVDIPAQVKVAEALANRLAAAVAVSPEGTIVLPDPLANRRSARSIVLTALVRTAQLRPAKERIVVGKLWSRLLIERDHEGSYGSSEATRHVVTALLRAESGFPSGATLRYTELSNQGKPIQQGNLDLAANGKTTLTLNPGTTSVRIETSTPGVLVHAERPLFRSFFSPVVAAQGPVFLDLSIPKPPTREGVTSLSMTVRQETGRAVPIVVRIPLPPGATLAEKVADMRQVQGAIYIRTTLAADTLPRVIMIPLRFSLSGAITLPEATARITDDDIATARSPARPLVVQSR
jgi:hypothetical protein